MKRIAIHQPNYLPGIRFFTKMASADLFILLDNVPYTKNNWTNRNRIRSMRGVQWLTVPVITSGRFGQLIREVEISGDRWRHVHWRTLQQAYACAPFVSQVLEVLEPVYATQHRFLADLNTNLILRISRLFDLPCQIVRASALSAKGSGTDLLLEICRETGATHYLSGIGGRKYLDVEKFERVGIQVEWQQFTHPIYPQIHGSFVMDLSIVDLLFNCGNDIRLLLGGR